MTRSTSFTTLLAASVLVALTGCGDASKPLPAPEDMGSAEPIVAPGYSIPSSAIQFRDEVESNRQDDGTVRDLTFTGSDGNPVSIQDYVGKKNVLLVFTRGFSGQLCPYCTTQTSRLIANYDKFTERDTEVLLVYPGSTDQLDAFRQASMAEAEKESFPFPVLLDEDLAAVKRLNIAAQLAFPSTFIINKDGRVTLSYVGKNLTDRPSIKALLAQLDSMPKT